MLNLPSSQEWGKFFFEAVFGRLDKFINFFMYNMSSKVLGRYGTILIIIGALVGASDKKLWGSKQHSGVVQLIRWSLATVFFYYLVVFILSFYPSPTYSFLESMKLRLFELFSLSWSVLFYAGLTFVAVSILNASKSRKNGTDVGKENVYHLRESQKSNRKPPSKWRVLLITCLLVIFGLAIYSTTNPRIYYLNTYTNNAQTRAVLWIGNYFNENPPDSPRTVYVEYVERNWLYSLAYNPLVTYENYEPDMFENYSFFVSRFDSQARFILAEQDKLTGFSESFNADFEVLYNETGYIFAEFKEGSF